HQLQAADFEGPFSGAKLDGLASRLDPFLAPLYEQGSGIVRVNIIARDGTILYSYDSDLRGEVLSPEDKALLATALGGTVAVERSSFSTLENADLKEHYNAIIEAYVPFE